MSRNFADASDTSCGVAIEARPTPATDTAFDRLEVGHYSLDDLPPALASGVTALLAQLLEKQPERADWWEMQFQLCHVHGLVEAFALAVAQARARPVVASQLDWRRIERQWQSLAPGQALPEAQIRWRRRRYA